MAQVPYNPVPQADPGATVSSVNPNVPAEAFGAGIGQAISNFGRGTSEAGSAVYERGIQLQNMNNQAEAREAAANYSIEVGKLSAKYGTLEGNAPAGAMGEYGAAIKQLKDKYKSGLSTTMAQHMFDNEALGTMTHALVNGASHAASQQKAYVVSSYDGKIKAAEQAISLNPNDAAFVAAKRKEIADTQREVDTTIHHLPPEVVENNARVRSSAALGTQIDAVAADNDLEARRVYLENKDDMTPADRKKYNDTTTTGVRNALTTKGVKDLIDANTDADGNLTITQKELFAKANELAKPYAKDDDKLPQLMQGAVQSQLNRDKYVKKNEINDANQTIYGQMLAGKTTLFDALQDPQSALAYRSLPNKEQQQWKDKFVRYEAAQQKTYNEEVMKQLDGMRSHSASMHEILEIDPTSKDLNLSRSNIDTVLRWQKEVKADLGKSGKADTFVKLLEDNYTSQLNNLGLMDRKDKTKYDGFVGNVMQAVEGWKESTGSKTYPTNQQFLKEIAPTVMRSQTKDSFSGRWFGAKTTGFERAEPTGDAYEAFKKAKTEEYKSKAVPVDEFEIQRQYSREVYKQLIDLQKKNSESK